MTQQLKQFRTELGLREAEFGKLFGFGSAAAIRVSEIENGKQPISRQVTKIYSLLMFLHEQNLVSAFMKENENESKSHSQ